MPQTRMPQMRPLRGDLRTRFRFVRQGNTLWCRQRPEIGGWGRKRYDLTSPNGSFAVRPGISHDDARLPPREHGRIRRLQPRSECGSAVTLTLYLLARGLTEPSGARFQIAGWEVFRSVRA